MLVEKIICADAIDGLKQVDNGSVDMCVTSPPYFCLRDYGVPGQIGLEKTPEMYIEKLVDVFREVKRVLCDDGTLWIVIGDSYNGSNKGGNNPKYWGSHTAFEKLANPATFGKPVRLDGMKPKDLIGIPWMLAFALRADGWYLRNDIIWYKPNAMPESVTDRCSQTFEHIFLLSKSKKYYFNNEAIKEPAADETIPRLQRGVSENHKYINGPDGQSKHTMNQPRQNIKNMQYVDEIDKKYEMVNKRNVWTVNTKSYSGSHFATYPPDLIRPCILAGSRKGKIVLDPFFGSGTTGIVASEEHRGYIGIEINPEYVEIARKRIYETMIQYRIEDIA